MHSYETCMDSQADGRKMEVVKQNRKMIMKTSTWVEVQLKRSCRCKHQISITIVSKLFVWCGVGLRLGLLLFSKPQLKIQWKLSTFNALLQMTTINWNKKQSFWLKRFCLKRMFFFLRFEFIKKKFFYEFCTIQNNFEAFIWWKPLLSLDLYTNDPFKVFEYPPRVQKTLFISKVFLHLKVNNVLKSFSNFFHRMFFVQESYWGWGIQ